MPQTKQQKAVVRRWIKALESGDYKQGRDYLAIRGETHDTFCCLGVLCDMAVRAKVIEPPELPQVGKTYSYKRHGRDLPNAVKEWAGLAEKSGVYDDYYSLAADNDFGETFKTIAKIIKGNPKGLFV